VVRAVEKVAKDLGNTPAICRRCYIHPAIFDGYLDGTLLSTLKEETRKYLTENVAGMSAEEAAVAAFLSLRLGELEREQKGGTASRSRHPEQSLDRQESREITGIDTQLFELIALCVVRLLSWARLKNCAANEEALVARISGGTTMPNALTISSLTSISN